MKKFILLGIACVVLFVTWYYLRNPLTTKVIVNGQTLQVETAVTSAEKQKGLGGRDALGENRGMLFIYQTKDRYGFWMEGMRFPLDFIWIDGNTVVDVSANVPAPTSLSNQPVELSPRVPVDKVLEVNASTIERLNIKPGDPVQFTD